MNWPTRSNTSELTSNTVHVWRVPARQTKNRLVSWKASLDDNERARAEKFYFDPDRERYISAHGALRQLLAAYLGAAAADLRFEEQEHGKPILAGPFSRTGLEFNLSHAAGWALIAVADGRRVGVDLEEIRPKRYTLGVAQTVFTPEEIDQLQALPEEARAEAFFQGWTRMEAYVKASGIGVIRGLRSADERRLPDEPGLLRPGVDRLRMNGWGVETLRPAPGYLGAVAAEGLEWQLDTWTFEPD